MRRQARRIAQFVSILAVLAVAAAVVLPAGSAARGLSAGVGIISPGNQHYAIDASWNARRRELTGTETIQFKNTRPGVMSTLHVRLWPNGETNCGRPFLDVTSVTGGTPQPRDVGCTDLPIALDTPVTSGNEGSVTLSFRDFVPQAWNFRYGISGDSAMLGYAFPIAALTDNDGLHLEPYTPNGEAMYSIVAAWDVTLELPSRLKAATTGVVTSSTPLPGNRTRLVISAPDERDFALSIGRYSVSETNADGVRIRYFRQDPNGPPASRILSWAARAVRSYTDHYGPYNQPEIDLAEGTWHANGFEFPSMLMISHSRDVVFHEVAHEWWYSMVGNNQWTTPWVDESFAQFSDRRLKGASTTWQCPHDPFAWTSGTMPLDANMGTFDADGHYIGVVYIAGPCALQMLLDSWGGAAFDAFLSDLQNDYRNGIETTCNVIDVLRQDAPGGFDVDGWLVTARLDSANC